MNPPNLIVTSGLPGTGKSTVAEGLARTLGAPLLSVDPIEAAMWRAGVAKSTSGIAAYQVTQALAAENLKLGQTVIVDAVNPVQAARQMWFSLAETAPAHLRFIEVSCSDEILHRERIEARVRGIVGMPEVTWDRVLTRKAEYESWQHDRLELDSAVGSPEMLIAQALNYVGAEGR